MADQAKIRVMIVDDIADTRDNLEKLLFFEKDIEVIAKAGNGREAVGLAKQHKPDVILMDINMPDMDGIAATEAILAQVSTVQIIIMSVQGELDYLRRAMLAGASEFLTKPIGADDLIQTIRNVAARKPRHSSQPVQPQQAAEATPQGQVFAVYSPKGGVGTSAVACNLAVALRQLTNKKVALIDGNLSFGSINVIMNLVSQKTITELSERIAELDRDMLNDVLATHNSQVKILLAPPDPQRGELVTADHVRTILELMRKEFDYIIVDTQSSFQDRALAVLDTSDRIVALMTLELTCIRNIKLFLEVAELLEYPSEKILLVLNKADSRLGLRVENVEENIHHKVAAQISNAANDMTLAINNGVPLVIEKRDHPTSKGIFALASMLSNGRGATTAPNPKAPPPPPPPKEKEKTGLFGRLLTKR